METLSIVVPCLNEQEAIPLFYSAFLKETAGMDVAFEFWFVDDGSTDGTLDALKRLREQDPAGEIYFLFPQLRQGERHVCGYGGIGGRVCGHHGRGFAGPSLASSADAAGHPSRRDMTAWRPAA